MSYLKRQLVAYSTRPFNPIPKGFKQKKVMMETMIKIMMTEKLMRMI